MPGGGTYPRSVFDRPELSLANLLEFGPGTAIRSVLKPSTLVGEERKSPAERLGVQGLLGGVLNTVSDPLLMLAIITSFKFPVAPLESLLAKVGPRFNALKKPLSGWLYNMRDPTANFAGTEIPEALRDIQATIIGRSHQYIPEMAAEVEKYQKAVGRVITVEDWQLASAVKEKLHMRAPYGFEKQLGPLLDAKQVGIRFQKDPAFKEFVEGLQRATDMMYDDFLKDPEARKIIASKYHKLAKLQVKEYKNTLLREGYSKSEIAEMLKLKKGEMKLPAVDGTDIEEFLKRVPEFLPHYPVPGVRDTREILKAILAREALPLRLTDQYFGGMMQQLVNVASPSVFRRAGSMLPSVEHLEKIGEYVNPRMLENMKRIIGESHARALGGEGLPILEYSLRGDQVFPEYIKSMAATEAWTLRGNGDKIMRAYEGFAGKGPGSDPIRAQILKDTVIPLALGRWTPAQAARQLAWANKVMDVKDWLDGPLGKLLPNTAKETMQRWLVGSVQRSTINPMSKAIQGYLYQSTIGGNPAAAVRNLFQIVLTTGPLIGRKYTWRGIESALKKGGDYFELRSGGLTHNEAFRTAFPHYFQSGLPLSPIAEETIGSMLSGTWDRTAGVAAIGVSRSKMQMAKEALMSLFGFSESAVRLVSFEGAMAKGLAEGLSIERVVPLARGVVEQTQFVPSLAGMPHFLAKMGPLSRQLLQFPAKFLGFATGTSLRAGSAYQSLGPGWGPMAGINPGTMARMYIWSDVIANVASNIAGTNVEQALLMGALPGFRESGPFAPLPVVPPFFALMGAPAYDIAKGDVRFEETRRVLPLLFPGGVGISKALGYVPIPGSAGVAKLLEKRYVDYRGATGDGRFPVYTSQGGLVGYMTVGQLMMQALGVPEGGQTKQVEQELMSMLVGNRDRIRDMKREYVRAVMNTDMVGANKIDEYFGQVFPQVGTIKKIVGADDFRRAQQRLEVTRMEQMLDTMPPEMRPMYGEALQTALMGADLDVLGVGEGELSSRVRTTVKQREGRRYSRPVAPATREYRNQLTPIQSGNMNLGAVSRPSRQGFADFAAFGS